MSGRSALHSIDHGNGPASLADDRVPSRNLLAWADLAGLVNVLARACFSLAQRPARTLLLRTRSMRWEGDPRVPVSADGEPAGHLPVDITVRPGAVRLVLPGCA